MKNLLPGVWISFCAAALAQPQPPQAESHRLIFDVASIKLNTSASTNTSINRALGGQLNCSNVSVRMLLTFAYDVRDYQLLNLPGWAADERYDILAKPSPEDAASEPDSRSDAAQNYLRRRTQSLLADRFGVVLHGETRDAPIYILVLAKGGSKLTPTQTEGGPQISFNYTRMTCKNVTMKRFADVALSIRMGRPVVDKTGLSGAYDFHVEFAPDALTTGASAATDQSGPSFTTALQEQLGLRIETSRGPTTFLLIDKVERPSAN